MTPCVSTDDETSFKLFYFDLLNMIYSIDSEL